MPLLHHRITGEGQPVIIIHGLFGSLENVGQLARRLAVHYQVHRVDVRNHGHSFHDDDMHYQAMAEDIQHYMSVQGLQRCWLIGHSMGGKIAMHMALCAPGKVMGLVVADIAPCAYAPDRHQALLAGLQKVAHHPPENRSVADTLLQAFVPELPVRQFLLKNLVTSDGRLTWRINLKAISDQYASHICAAIDVPDARYDGPCLFLKGAQSDYILPQHHAQITRLFPNANITAIDPASHWLHAEQPDACAQAIVALIHASSDSIIAYP